MNFRNWYEIRGPRFIWQRGISLLERYDLRPDKAIDSINSCAAEMLALGCSPTFLTPGIIIKRYPKFIRSLQDAGVEIAVHGYYHINLRDIPLAAAVHQLLRAVQTFERFGIEVHGFRCPYMGCSDELLDSLPAGIFEYSSNQSIYWGGIEEYGHQHENLIFDTLNRFYKPKDPSQKISLPCMCSSMVEIPVCIPDDLQFYYGLQFDSAGIAQAWEKILNQTYLRGELFTLLFHTELASLFTSSLGTLIRQAQRYEPGVWIANLRDISDWWQEKSNFKIEITPITSGLRLVFICTPRATVLVRGIDAIESMPSWDGGYHRLQSNVIDISTGPRPFVGLAPNTSECTISFLRDQGYILDTGETARSCGIFIEKNILSNLTNEVELVNYIESSPGPLIRFWRWPNGAKSSLCITGDLDALSLFDYASRIFIG